MSSADLLGVIVARWLRNRPRRYGFAVALVAVATLVRYAPGVCLGPFCGFPPRNYPWSPCALISDPAY